MSYRLETKTDLDVVREVFFGELCVCVFLFLGQTSVAFKKFAKKVYFVRLNCFENHDDLLFLREAEV